MTFFQSDHKTRSNMFEIESNKKETYLKLITVPRKTNNSIKLANIHNSDK